MSPRRIAVIGGGISGLSAAFTLSQARRAGAPLEEYLIEASPRLGGALRTAHADGCLVEAGADSFLTEKGDAIQLCEQLGLAGELIGSDDQPRRTWILHRGKLVPLPEGLEFMVPARVWAVAGTPLLSLRDKLGLVNEVFTRPHPPQGDESVARFVERHFGRSLLENIVDPLLTAVYGGDSGALSAAAVLPRFVEMEEKWGSLVRGVRQAARQRAAQGAPAKEERTPRALFTTLRSGLETLIAALRGHLANGRVLCGRPVQALTARSDGGYRIVLEGGGLDADVVVLALPAYEAARLLRQRDPRIAESLAAIPYSSSMIVALGYDAGALRELPAGFGFLVPRKEQRRLLACTFVGQKFPGRVPPDRVLLRCFLGGVRDEAVLELTDAQAISLVREELRGILGIAAEPRVACVYRWPKALAQYTLGHQERVKAIESRRAAHPGLFLCGNAYQGIGVPDCIRSGRAAAEACLRPLRAQ